MALPRLFWMWLLVAGTRGANDGDMRLADGDTTNQGRVEIFYQGQWGTVCDNLWDLLDASVVCRALGFENATEALGQAAFGPGSGPVMLDEVQCTGTEPSLANCSSLGWLTSKCGHSQDAGVICSNGSPVTPALQERAESLQNPASQPPAPRSPSPFPGPAQKCSVCPDCWAVSRASQIPTTSTDSRLLSDTAV